MKSSQVRKAVVVSIFTIIGIAIFIAGVLTLGGQRKLFVASISVKASFDNVNGLQAGNNVRFKGVKIGTVKSVSFSENSGVDVLMNIETKSSNYVHQDVRAKIGSDGLIGNRIVIIEGGSAQSPLIHDGSLIQVTQALSTEDLLNTLQKNNLNLLDITGDLKTVTYAIAHGEGTVGGLIKDKSLLNNLQSAVSILKQASLNTRQVTSDLASYSSKLQTKGSLANDLVTDTMIFFRLRTTASKIQEVSNTVEVIANNLETASKNINDSTKAVGSLINDQTTAEDLRITLQYLKSSSQKLDEDLEALQHHWLFSGYFKNKEKQEAKEKKQKK